MTRQVIWDKKTIEMFINEGNLTGLERRIIEAKGKDLSQVQIALAEHTSIATVNRVTRRLKVRYDEVQRKCPDMRPRARCAKELYNE